MKLALGRVIGAHPILCKKVAGLFLSVLPMSQENGYPSSIRSQIIRLNLLSFGDDKLFLSAEALNTQFHCVTYFEVSLW